MEAERDSLDRYIVYCAPCRKRIAFTDSNDAPKHANAHGSTVAYTEFDGNFIETPEAYVHTPTPVLTADDLLDVQDIPLDQWSAAFRSLVVAANA